VGSLGFVDNNYSFDTYVRFSSPYKKYFYPSPHTLVKIRMGKLTVFAQTRNEGDLE
jgi:hypothetical protein